MGVTATARGTHPISRRSHGTNIPPRTYRNAAGFMPVPSDIHGKQDREVTHERGPRSEGNGLVTVSFWRCQHKASGSCSATRSWQCGDACRRRGSLRTTTMCEDLHDYDEQYRSLISSPVNTLWCKGWGVQCKGWGVYTPRGEFATKRTRDARFIVSLLGCKGCKGGISYYRVASVRTHAHARLSGKLRLPLHTLYTPFVGSQNAGYARSPAASVCKGCKPPTLYTAPPTLYTPRSQQEIRSVNRGVLA